MEPTDLDYTEFKTNRQKQQTPRGGGRIWCAFCDRAIVDEGKHCKVCHRRMKTRTLKRERV